MSKNIKWQNYQISLNDRIKKNNHRPAVLWFTGLSGSGKSTLANSVLNTLFEYGYQCFALDGDNMRHGLNRDLGFSDTERKENIRRVAEVAKLFYEAGFIITTAFISPFAKDRNFAKKIIGNAFFEIFLDTPLNVCEQRDPKGFYEKARSGQIQNFTGIDSQYEIPQNPDLIIQTHTEDLQKSTEKVLSLLKQHKII